MMVTQTQQKLRPELRRTHTITKELMVAIKLQLLRRQTHKNEFDSLFKLKSDRRNITRRR